MVFHKFYFYSTTLAAISHMRTFLCARHLDPYIRRFVSSLGHSDHRHFIDPRPVGDTIHLWTAFVVLFCQPHYGRSQPTSPSSRPLEFPHIEPVGVSEQAFLGVTPSFHLSGYQFS